MLLAEIDAEYAGILWFVYVLSTVATIVPVYSAFRTPLPKEFVAVISVLAVCWGAFLTYANIHDGLGWDINWLFSLAPLFAGALSLWGGFRRSRSA